MSAGFSGLVVRDVCEIGCSLAAPPSLRPLHGQGSVDSYLAHISLASRSHLVTSRHLARTSPPLPSHVQVGLRGGEVVSYVVTLTLTLPLTLTLTLALALTLQP